MSQELIYTSAPRGLKRGSRGFCTVVSTFGMAANLAGRLESLSGYRHVYQPQDANARLNPVGFSHLLLAVGGRSYHVLSRIADAGLDYTQRTNKLAHHVVLDASERVAGGPAWLLRQPGFVETRFEGEPRVLQAGRKPPDGDRPPGVCRQWANATGDAGWAGALAEAIVRGRKAFLVFPPGVEMLPLVDEALALLPPQKRWSVTFSTYFTGLPPGIDCRLACVLQGSPEQARIRRVPNAFVVDLSAPAGRAPETPYVAAARSGDVSALAGAGERPGAQQAGRQPAARGAAEGSAVPGGAAASAAQAAVTADGGPAETYGTAPPPLPAAKGPSKKPLAPRRFRRKQPAQWPYVVLGSLAVLIVVGGSAALWMATRGGAEPKQVTQVEPAHNAPDAANEAKPVETPAPKRKQPSPDEREREGKSGGVGGPGDDSPEPSDDASDDDAQDDQDTDGADRERATTPAARPKQTGHTEEEEPPQPGPPAGEDEGSDVGPQERRDGVAGSKDSGHSEQKKQESEDPDGPAPKPRDSAANDEERPDWPKEVDIRSKTHTSGENGWFTIAEKDVVGAPDQLKFEVVGLDRTLHEALPNVFPLKKGPANSEWQEWQIERRNAPVAALRVHKTQGHVEFKWNNANLGSQLRNSLLVVRANGNEKPKAQVALRMPIRAPTLKLAWPRKKQAPSLLNTEKKKLIEIPNRPPVDHLRWEYVPDSVWEDVPENGSATKPLPRVEFATEHSSANAQTYSVTLTVPSRSSEGDENASEPVIIKATRQISFASEGDAYLCMSGRATIDKIEPSLPNIQFAKDHERTWTNLSTTQHIKFNDSRVKAEGEYANYMKRPQAQRSPHREDKLKKARDAAQRQYATLTRIITALDRLNRVYIGYRICIDVSDDDDYRDILLVEGNKHPKSD